MDLKVTRILISDKVDKCCEQSLTKNGFTVDYKPGLEPAQLKEIIHEYDCLIVRSATKVTAEVFECATSLKLVGRAGTGVDNIDLKAASANGVLVMNTPGGNTLSAAEHTCVLISSLARNVGQAYASMLEGKWERSKFMGNELYGKTLAIVGLGRIGREVAARMQSYGMETIGFDPMVSAEEADKFNIKWLPLDELWSKADYVTVHVPLIPQTKGMIDSGVFSRCKRGMRVVNVARGGIIDEGDLLAALNDGTCGGAALDVFVSEPPTGLSLELTKHPKVVCTPHLGASTQEAQTRVAMEIADQITDACGAWAGKPIVGLVNAPALSHVRNPDNAPWLALLRNVGTITAALLEDSDKTITIRCQGSISGLVLQGFAYGFATRRSVDKRASNLINSMTILEQLDFKVVVRKLSETSSISITTEALQLCATLCDKAPVLLQLHRNPLPSPVALRKYLVIGKIESENALAGFLSSFGRYINGFVVESADQYLVADVSKDISQNLSSPLVCIEL